MRFAAAVALSVTLASGAAMAQTLPTCPTLGNGGCGISVPTSPTVVLNVPTSSPRSYYRNNNAGTPSQGTAWCSWGGTAAVNGGGSYPIGPFGNTPQYPSSEEFSATPATAGQVPQETLSCISDGGTGGNSPAVLTLKVH